MGRCRPGRHGLSPWHKGTSPRAGSAEGDADDLGKPPIRTDGDPGARMCGESTPRARSDGRRAAGGPPAGRRAAVRTRRRRTRSAARGLGQAHARREAHVMTRMAPECAHCWGIASEQLRPSRGWRGPPIAEWNASPQRGRRKGFERNATLDRGKRPKMAVPAKQKREVNSLPAPRTCMPTSGTTTDSRRSVPGGLAVRVSTRLRSRTCCL
jgi:hypothetical protein